MRRHSVLEACEDLLTASHFTLITPEIWSNPSFEAAAERGRAGYDNEQI